MRVFQIRCVNNALNFSISFQIQLYIFMHRIKVMYIAFDAFGTDCSLLVCTAVSMTCTVRSLKCQHNIVATTVTETEENNCE